MVKVFRDFIAESKLRIPKKPSKEDLDGVRSFMDRRYQEVEPDLPRHGNYHFNAAVDHLGDYAYDEISRHHYGKVPKSINLGKMAREVVKRYADDDTVLSKRNERKRASSWEKSRERLAKQKTRHTLKAAKTPKEKRWDDVPPPPKYSALTAHGTGVRRGIGSK